MTESFLNSDGQQFHQYMQNEQAYMSSNHETQLSPPNHGTQPPPPSPKQMELEIQVTGCKILMHINMYNMTRDRA